jgi:WD40 repeat protein
MLTWQAHDDPVYDLAFSPDSRRVVTSDTYKTRLWEIGTQKLLRHWDRPSGNRAVTFSPNGRFIGTSDPAVWPVAGDSPIVEHTATTDSVAFSPDGKLFVAHGYSDYPIRRWALPSGKPLAEGWGPSREGAAPFGPIAFSPDGSCIAASFGVSNELTGRHERVILLLDRQSGVEIGRLRPVEKVPHLTRLAFAPDGHLLAGLCVLGFVLWDVSSGREVGRGQVAKKRFKGFAFTPDGSRLLTASDDAYLRVWTAPTWEQTTTYAWKIGKLGCVAVSADGTVAAAAGSTGKVVVWDLD